MNDILPPPPLSQHDQPLSPLSKNDQSSGHFNAAVRTFMYENEVYFEPFLMKVEDNKQTVRQPAFTVFLSFY